MSGKCVAPLLEPVANRPARDELQKESAEVERLLVSRGDGHTAFLGAPLQRSSRDLQAPGGAWSRELVEIRGHESWPRTGARGLATSRRREGKR